MPNCYAYVSQHFIVRLRTGRSGAAAITFTMPKDANLIGTHFYTQFIVSDPGANATGFTMSNALDTRLGR